MHCKFRSQPLRHEPGLGFCSQGSRALGWASCFGTPRNNEAWFSDFKGIEAPKLELSNFGELRGMKAKQDISAGEALATVSLECTLLVEPFRRCPFKDLVSEEQWKRSPWYLKMALMLLHERDIRGQNSHLKDYMADLEAASIDTPVAWTQEEVAELQYPFLQDEIAKQKAAWIELYKAVASASSRRITQKDLFWAMQAVRSRAFSGPYSGTRLRTRVQLFAVLLGVGAWFLLIAHTPIEKVLNAGIAAVLFNIMYDALLSRKLKWFAMLPVIDYCNHSPKVQSNVSFEVFRERFAATITTPVTQGKQVSISYGKHNNDYLMQYFGFSLENLQGDVYSILVGEDFKAVIDDAPPQLHLTAQGLRADSLAWLQGLSNQKAAYKEIVDICQKEQKLWVTDSADDKRSLEKGNRRTRAAVQFRLEKKKLLQKALKILRQKSGMSVEQSRKQAIAN